MIPWSGLSEPPTVCSPAADGCSIGYSNSACALCCAGEISASNGACGASAISNATGTPPPRGHRLPYHRRARFGCAVRVSASTTVFNEPSASQLQRARAAAVASWHIRLPGLLLTCCPADRQRGADPVRWVRPAPGPARGSPTVKNRVCPEWRMIDTHLLRKRLAGSAYNSAPDPIDPEHAPRLGRWYTPNSTPLANQSHRPKTAFILGSRTPRKSSSSPRMLLNSALKANNPSTAHAPANCSRPPGTARTLPSAKPAGSAHGGEQCCPELSESRVDEDAPHGDKNQERIAQSQRLPRGSPLRGSRGGLSRRRRRPSYGADGRRLSHTPHLE